MTGSNIHIFTVGGEKAGFGHVVRMIPVYDVFVEEGYRPKLYIDGDSSVDSLINERCFYRVKWKFQDNLNIKNTDIVIIDTLRYPSDFISRVSFQTSNICFVSDDFHHEVLPVNVINWRVNSRKESINQIGLIGEKYVPLRKDILPFREFPGKDKKKSVIISMGSGDVLNLVPITIDIILKNFPNKYNIKVIVSKNNQKYFSLLKSYKFKVDFLVDLDAISIYREMATSDYAIASGGHSIYEYETYQEQS